jgi:hypothetical protein
MILRETLVIPQEAIEAARWLCSLPVVKIGPYTARIYRAVANLKAAQLLGTPTKYPMEELGRILIEAAGDASVLDEIVRAKKTLAPRPVRRKGTGIWKLLTAPAAALSNEPKRPVALQFVEAVDALQKRHGRTPTRSEIIKSIDDAAFDQSECTRQVEKQGWGEWL